MGINKAGKVVATALAGLLLAGAGFLAGTRVRASGAEPGSAADPLVSKSYVDEYVRTYVDQQLTRQVGTAVEQRLAPALAQLKPPEPPRFQVVNLLPGQTLWADASTELVLRAGLATVIAGPSGGIADLTAGTDLGQDDDVPANHLLVVPRADGRGIRATTPAVVMVRGGFVVQEAPAQ